MGNLCLGGGALPKDAAEEVRPQQQPGARTTTTAATAAVSSPSSAPAASDDPEHEAFQRRLAATPTLDEDRLHELMGVVDVRETLHGFIKHGRQQLDALVASIEGRDPGTGRVAHALKGAAKTVGAARLAACAAAIEDEAKREGGDVGACGRFIPGLRAALDDLAEEVCARPWQ